MQHQQKQQILEAVNAQLALQGLSQSKAAKVIGISGGYLSLIRQGEWTNISDAVWRKCANWCGFTSEKKWGIYETPNLASITKLCAYCQKESNFRAIAGYAGAGKTVSLTYYARTNKNAYYISCEEYFTKKIFLQEIAKSCGVDVGGMNTYDTMSALVEHFNTCDKPLLLIDEADKLKDPVLNLVKSIYNLTEGRLGMVICGVEYLKNRLDKGVNKHKSGYDELYSRLGRRFSGVEKPDRVTIKNICYQLGIESEVFVSEVFNQCKDFRQVRLMIEYKLVEQLKQVA